MDGESNPSALLKKYVEFSVGAFSVDKRYLTVRKYFLNTYSRELSLTGLIKRLIIS